MYGPELILLCFLCFAGFTVSFSHPYLPITLRYLPAVIVLFNIINNSLHHFRNVCLAWKGQAQLIPQYKSENYPFNLNIPVGAWINLQHGLADSIADIAFEQQKSDIVGIQSIFINHNFNKDPLIMHQALAGPSLRKYGKGHVQEALNDFLGNGILVSDANETWKLHRFLIKPFFNKNRISEFNMAHLEKMIDSIKQQELKPVDMQDTFLRLTFDQTSEFFFGYQTNMMENSFKGTMDPLTEALHKVAYDSLKAFILKDARYAFESVFGSLTKPHMERIHKSMNKVIDAAIERQNENERNHKEVDPKSCESALDYLVTQTKDRGIIRDGLMNLLVAGRDSTAALMTSMLVQLAQHPDVYEKARDECIRLFGEDGPIDHQVMNRSKFLRAIVNETLRLNPSLPLNPQYAHEDDILTTSDGRKVFIPKGSYLMHSIWRMHRDTKLWGKDAETWDPERWIDSRAERLTMNPHIFMPFSVGPRICLGQGVVVHLALCTLIRIAQSFKAIEPAQESYIPESHFTLLWQGGAWLRMVPS